MTAQSLAQKLIARAAGQASVRFGEIVTCRVDLAMFHDSSGPRRLKPMLEELGATIWDKSRVVLVMDHYVPERDEAPSDQQRVPPAPVLVVEQDRRTVGVRARVEA